MVKCVSCKECDYCKSVGFDSSLRYCDHEVVLSLYESKTKLSFTYNIIDDVMYNDKIPDWCHYNEGE